MNDYNGGTNTMNDYNLIQQAVVTDHNGLLPHPVSYAQVEPSRLPVTAQALRRRGYREMQYRWLHIPTGKSGVSTVWVFVERLAGVLVEFWNRIGGSVWKYSLVCPACKGTGKKVSRESILGDMSRWTPRRRWVR